MRKGKKRVHEEETEKQRNKGTARDRTTKKDKGTYRERFRDKEIDRKPRQRGLERESELNRTKQRVDYFLSLFFAAKQKTFDFYRKKRVF